MNLADNFCCLCGDPFDSICTEPQPGGFHADNCSPYYCAAPPVISTIQHLHPQAYAIVVMCSLSLHATCLAPLDCMRP